MNVTDDAMAGRDLPNPITTLDQLVQRVQEWFGYDRLEESPFPSGEHPEEATLFWYRDRLKLTVVGPNKFKMTCPGCQTPTVFVADDLHTCEMFDYSYWRFCATCSALLGRDEATGA